MLGFPCEQYFTTDIPGGQPLALANIEIPRPDFSIAQGLTVTNGTNVGAFGFSIHALSGCPAVAPNVVVPYPTVTFLDSAMGNNSTAGDPVHTGGADGVDSSTPGIANLYNPAVWPTQLNSDPTVAFLVTSGITLHARYSAPVLALGSSINILVFDFGTYYLQVAVSGDPTTPSTVVTCTPFHSQADYLGDSTDIGTGLPVTLRQCNSVGVKTFKADWTRADTFEASQTIDTTNSCVPSDTSVTCVKNETLPTTGNEIDGGITNEQTITCTVIGTGDLSLSLVGPAVCNPHFTVPLDFFPSNFGGTQTSTAFIAGASGTVTIKYSFNCPPGDFNFQFIANLSPGSEDTADNQFENHIHVHVIPDLDNDGIPNNVDQCPTVADPEGHGPDPSDTVPSNGCPDTDISVAVTKEENFNVDVSVDTAKAVTIVVSNSEFPADVQVNITAISLINTTAAPSCEVRVVPHAGDTYSEYFTAEPPTGPVNTLTSQASFIIHNMPVGSQTFNYTYIIHCYQKSTHVGVFELQVDALPLSPVREENLGSCTAGTGGTGQPACIPDPANPHNNVHKNFPTVTAFDRADLSKGNCTTTADVTQANGDPAPTAFHVSQTCTIKNNGTVTVDYTDTATISGPFTNDCTLAAATPATQSSSSTLTGGQQTQVGIQWTVTCQNPSNHPFTVNDTVTFNPSGPNNLHVYDPCTGTPGPVPSEPPCANNNNGSGTVTVEIFTTVDPFINGSCSAPGSVNAGTAFNITCTGNINLDGTIGGTLGAPCTPSTSTVDCITATFVAPADCTFLVDPDGPGPLLNVFPIGNILQGSQQLPAGSYPSAAQFTVRCSSGSDHPITSKFQIFPKFPNHVSEEADDTTGTDPDGTDISVGSTTTTIQAFGILAVTVTGVTTPIDLLTGNSTVIHPVVTVSNTGDPVTVGTTTTIAGSGPSPCIVSALTGDPNPSTDLVAHNGSVSHNYTATITMPAGDVHECTYTVSATADTDHPTQNNGHDHGSATGSFVGTLETNVLQVKYVILVGPAAVNLSDTNGRYMWVISEIGNFSSTPELVRVNMSITPNVPAGCTSVPSQILPGQSQFTIGSLTNPHEQKVLVWRVRFECHAPTGGAQVINQSVTVGVTHCDTSTSNPPLATPPVGTVTAGAPGGICSANTERFANGDVETVLSDNSVTTTKQVILQ